MRFRARLRPRKAKIVSAIALALSVTTVVVMAFASNGYPLDKVDLNDGSVWVTDDDLGMLGRFNVPISQLDSELVANHDAQPDVDVLQRGGVVFAIDHSANTLRRVDVANVALGDETVDIPPDAGVAYGGDVVAISDPATGRVWTRSAAGATSLSIANAKPTTMAGAKTAITVGADGVAYAFAPATGMLTTIRDGGTDKPSTEGRRTGLAGTAAQIATVGTRPVALVDGQLLLPGGKVVALPRADAASAILQQSGPDNDRVYVATSTSLYEVDLATGRIATRYAQGGGAPAAPVFVKGCVHAAWGGNARYLRRCAGAPPEAARPLQGLPASPRLVFRVNRDQVVLNEAAIGSVYVYARGGVDLGNWQALIPKPQTAKTEKNKTSEKDKRNHAPTARPDSYGARPGETSVLHVLDNDGDADHDVLIIASVSGLPAIAGRVAIVANGQAIQFTADVTWKTGATFTYRINDGNGGTDSAKVTLTSRASGSNQPPAETPRGSAASVATGGTVSYNVMADWRDPDGDPLTLVDAQAKAPDTVRFTADGKVTFTAGGTATGDRVVHLKISDGGVTPVSGELTMHVVARDHGAIGANDDRITGVVGQAIAIHPLDNDTDPNTTVATGDEQLRLLQVSAARAGTTVTPDYDHSAIRFVAQRAQSYYLTYQATDNVKTGSARIRVDVVAPSTANPPIAVADRAVVRGDVPTDVDVLANDIDPSGNVLVVSSVTAPPGAGVTATVIGHRWVRVTPDHEGAGSLTLHYTLSDGGGSDTGAIAVTQLRSSAGNQPPTPRDDVATVRAGDVTTIDVLANDTDPEGEPLTLAPEITANAAAGTWVVSGRTIRFVAPAKAGTAIAHYTVRDPEGVEASATVTITVTAPNPKTNQPPQPPTVQARVFAGATVRIPIPLSGVDPDGDSAVLLGATVAPRLGRITAQGPGYFLYQAYAKAAGTDSFSYRLEDPYGARGGGTVRVGVIPAPAEDAAPSAVNDDVTVAPGVTAHIPVLGNDTDIDGDPLTVEPLAPLNPSLPAGVSLDGAAITVRAGAHDGDQIKVRYGESDGRGQRAEATVTVTSRKDAKVPPVAIDDLAKPVAAAAATELVDVLANDYDIDGGAGDLTLVALDGDTGHPSQVTPKGLLVTLTERPRLVPYEIVDSTHLAAMAFVQVPGVAGDLPRRDPNAPGLEVNAGGTLTVDLARQVIDPNGLPVRLTDAAGISTSPRPGLALAPTGLTATSLVIKAVGSYAGPASLVVTVTDAPVSGAAAADVTARTASITLPVTVLAPPTATPVFACPAARPQAGGIPVKVNLATCVSGISPHAAARLSFSPPHGVATGVTARSSGGVLTVSADERAKTNTRSTMSFQVTDADGRSGPAVLGVVVSPAPLVKPGNDTIDVEAGSTARVNLVANDQNPFPGKPLTLKHIDAASGGVTAKVVSASDVSVTAAPDVHGAVTLSYQVGDATNDSSRVVYGELFVNVIGKPGAPGVPVEQSVGDGYAIVAWTAAASNGADITSYQVTGSPSFSQTCPATVCKLTGLRNGAKYRFQVRAVNRVGVGPAGGESLPMEPDVVPDQPSAPLTTFGNAQITLDWAPAHSSGSAVKYYLVQISPPVGQPQRVTGTHLVWGGLANGASYTFRVKAYNDQPQGSDWSPYSKPEIPATVPGQPVAPTGAGVNDGIGKQIVVNWQAPATNGAPITAYHLSVYRSGSLVQTLAEDGDVTQATVSVDNGVNYTFSVTATNKAGTSVASSRSAAIVAHGKPAVITSFNVSDHSGVTGLNGAFSYTLTAPDDNGMAISTYQFSWSGGGVDASRSSTSGQIGGLTNGTSYQIRVRACNDMCGDWSSPSSTIKPYGPVPQPHAGAARSGSRQIVLSWSSGGTNGRPIDHMDISVDGGGWQSVGVSGSRTVGDGPSQTHSIQVRAVDTAGQTSAVASASATTDPPSVTVSHGPLASPKSTCPSGCDYIHVELRNFPSNASVTCSFNSFLGSEGFVTYTLGVDGSGNGGGNSPDFYGRSKTWVQATCNGVVGTDNSW